MAHERKPLLLIALAALSASCGLAEGASTPTPAIGGPVCFSPHEFLPFAFSPDSSRILIRSADGVEFIALETGQEVSFLPAPGPVLAAALSPDGETLAWSLDDTTVQLVQVSDGAVRHTLSGHPDPALHLRFSPNGTQLFSASHDALVRVWDVATGAPLAPIHAGREVVGIGVSPDGATLATIPGDGPVQLWDIVTGREQSTLGGTGGLDTSDAVFSPDGRYLAADLATGLFLWRLSDGQAIWDGVHNSMAVAYSPDGQFLAYSDIAQNNQVILAAPDASGDFNVIDEMQGPVWEVFFSLDSSRLAATDGSQIRVWRIPGARLLAIGELSCE